MLRHFRDMLRPGGTAYVSTPNLLTLAPPGAEKSDNPWHVKEYRAEEFRALCESVFGRRRAARALPRPGAARARAGAARRLGPRARRARDHEAVLRPLHAGHLRARLRAAPGAARARARLRRGAPALTAGRQDGALAIVLHSHMPYVEGFGTWPFGEEWLWEAVACVYLPLLDVLDGAPVTLGLTPVLCDQLEAMRGDAGRPLPALPARDPRADPRRGRGGPRRRRASRELAAEMRRAAGDYTRADEAFEDRGRDLLGAFGGARAGRALDLRRHARPAAADGHRRRRAAAGGHRHRGAPAPLRRLGRRLLAAGVRLRARPRARARRPRRARLLRRPDRAWPGFDHLTPGRHRGRPGRRADRLGRRSSSSGTTSTATPRTAPTATTGAARVHDLQAVEQRRASRTTTTPRSSSRASTRATSCARAAEKLAGGGLLCCALDTELLGHWWYEGLDWLARRARGGGRRRACGS